MAILPSVACFAVALVPSATHGPDVFVSISANIYYQLKRKLSDATLKNSCAADIGIPSDGMTDHRLISLGWSVPEDIAAIDKVTGHRKHVSDILLDGSVYPLSDNYSSRITSRPSSRWTDMAAPNCYMISRTPKPRVQLLLQV